MNEFGEIIGPDNNLAIARAITYRSMLENSRNEGITTDVLAIPQEPTSERVKEATGIGATVIALKKIEQPDLPVDIDNVLDNVFDQTTLDIILDDDGLSKTDTNRAILRDTIDSVVRPVFDLLKDDSKDDDNLLTVGKQLDSALEVAEEHGVPVTRVFEDDGLYEEMLRSMYTPEEFVRSNLRCMEKISQEFFRSVLSNLAGPIVREELGDGASDLDIQLETIEFIEELRADPEYHEVIDESVAIVKDGMRAITLAGLERFWGIDAVNNLPEELLEKLM